MQQVMHTLLHQVNSEHNEESKKALRNLAIIIKFYRNDKLGVEMLLGLSKLLSIENPSVFNDISSILKGIVEKINTGSAVMGILESLKKLDPPALQVMLDYLVDIIKERANIGFFSKEIAIRLKEVRFRQYFTHPHPEIRKSIVLTLAELLSKTQDPSFMNVFNQSQQKLIEIYRQKLSLAEE